MSMSFRAPLGALSVTGATLVCLAGAGPAMAAPCNAVLLDPTNARFDLVHEYYGPGTDTPQEEVYFAGAGIGDGAVLNADGSVRASDAYDSGPGLAVFDVDANPNFDASVTGPGDAYPLEESDAADGCRTAQDGREVLFPAKTMHTDLEVSRRIHVADSGPGGARFIDTVRNTSEVARTVSVRFGWVDSDFGSDTRTRLVTYADDESWLVTDDTFNTTTPSDPKLTHVISGPGGRPHDGFSGADGNDRLHWYHMVTIAPGQSASFLTYEGMTALADAAGTGRATDAEEQAAAAALARTLSAQPSARLYAGLTAGEILAVRNWARPTAKATIDVQGTPTDGAPVTLKATVDTGAAGCAVTSHKWTVDGAVAGTGATLTTTPAAGERKVKLEVTTDCAGAATVERTVTVAQSRTPQQPQPQPQTTSADPPTKGKNELVAPAGPVKVVDGKATLRFVCADADGCTARRYVLFSEKKVTKRRNGKKFRVSAFRVMAPVPSSASAMTHAVAFKLPDSAVKRIRKAGRKGLRAKVRHIGKRDFVLVFVSAPKTT